LFLCDIPFSKPMVIGLSAPLFRSSVNGSASLHAPPSINPFGHPPGLDIGSDPPSGMLKPSRENDQAVAQVMSCFAKK
jgi:hypothetical protein